MKIKQIHITNFKSIVDVRLDNLADFSVFAGANGSGKSNFFEALEFVRDVVRNGAKQAIYKHGGYESIHSRKLRYSSAQRFYATFKLTLSDNFIYQLEIRDMHKTPFLLETISKNGEEIASRKNRTKIEIKGDLLDLDYSDDETLLKLVSKDAQELLEFLSAIERYQVDPNQAREPDDYAASDLLEPRASNLITVLARLEKDKAIAEAIVDAMSMIVPGFESFKLEKERLSSKTLMTFKETGLNKRFPAGLVSDGTIYALAMLVIIYSNHKGIVLIEEPERGLNPKAIAELIEYFRDRSTDCNIFINTHSESVVAETRPEELLIVDKIEGQSEISRVIDKFPDYDYKSMGLQQMWLSNLFAGGLPW
jgi:predicted ATPase